MRLSSAKIETMPSWRVKRRLIYFFIFLAAVSAVVLFFYLAYRPAPSCFDGKQNQDELGVDCGGVCAKVCSFEVRDLKIIWARVFKTAPDRYDVASLVENPNLRHAVGVFKYNFKIFDEDNLLVYVRSGETFLNPAEQFVIFESRLDLGKRLPARATMEMAEPPLWQKVDRKTPKLIFSTRLFSNEPAPRLLATVANPTLINLRDVTVAALLSGGEGNALAVSSTLVEELPAGGSAELVFTWPRPLAAAPAAFDYFPHFDLRKLP